MESNHLSDRQLKLYETRAAAPSDLVEMDDHLHACDACYRRFLAHAGATDAFDFQAEDFGDHAGADPLYSYLESFVDGKLSGPDMARIERHLENCESCASEAEGLLRLKTRISSQPEMGPTRRSSMVWGSAFYFLESARVHKAAWVSGAVAGGAALVICAYQAGSLHSRHLRAEIAVVEAENSRLKESSAEQNRTSAGQLEQLRREHGELQKSYDARQSELESLRNRLNAGRSTVRAGNTITVEIRDGERLIGLRRNGESRGMEDVAQSLRVLARSALMTGRTAMLPQLRLNGRRPSLMGTTSGEESFALISPLGTAVTSDRPELDWQPLAGATNYEVTLRDSSTNQQETVVSGSHQWTPEHALVRGRLYYWQVKAERQGREIVSPSPSQPPARFWVLSLKDLEHLEQIKRKYRDSHLVLGVAYANSGLVDEAIGEFRALSSQNPGSEAIRRILTYLDTLQR
jgi:hypothetical protein